MSIPENTNQDGAGAAASHIPKKEVKNEPMAINVKDNNGNEILFKVRPQTKFKKLFTAYCERQGKNYDACRFVYDGTRLLDSETPAEVSISMICLHL